MGTVNSALNEFLMPENELKNFMDTLFINPPTEFTYLTNVETINVGSQVKIYFILQIHL
jgi:hypothetical protein